MTDVVAAFKSHLDGDITPREDELDEWNEIREANGQDVFLCAIVIPDPGSEPPFPGMHLHWWEISEKNGVVVCEPTEVDLEIVPEDSSYSGSG